MKQRLIRKICLLLTVVCATPVLAAKITSEPAIAAADLRIRDPFIVVDRKNSRYLMYAQTGNRKHSDKDNGGIECYSSKDLESWTPQGNVAKSGRDFNCKPAFWAPEVHEVDGMWYLFFTCTLEGSNVPRNTIILRAGNPLGPFTEYGEKPKPPLEQRTLDGTFWRDDNGQNWLIYCHEWVQIGDGAVRAIKLTKDMTATTGVSILLFKASESGWAESIHTNKNSVITDGCFLYKTKRGDLLMIWSSFRRPDGPKSKPTYSIGVARSASGKVEGPWKHDKELLYEKHGGHGMLFKGLDNKLYMAFHQPNDGAKERLRLIELVEQNNRLIPAKAAQTNRPNIQKMLEPKKAK